MIYNDLEGPDCMECFICDKRICLSCLPIEAPRFGLLRVCGECEQKNKSENQPNSYKERINTADILNDLTRDTPINSAMINANIVFDDNNKDKD